jgi:hypothetical protein
MAYIPSSSHATLLATVRRERLLPGRGEVIARADQRVEAADVIARGDLADRHILLDVARSLNLPRTKAAAALKKQEGEEVKKGEAIAERQGLFGAQRVASPVDGRLVLFEEGKALVAGTTPLELRAGLPGNVVGTLPDRGVIIETTGALLEGVWGNGLDDFSVLRMLSRNPEEPIQSEQLDLGLRGAIIAVSLVPDAALFQSLKDIGIRGLITGAAPADLLPALQALPFPVIVTEGFGGRGLCEPAFNLLAGNSGREAWLNAASRDRFAGKRPEVIIPLPSPSTMTPPPPSDGETLKEGKRVRVLRGPDAGRVGTVVGLSDRPMQLSSGIRAQVAAVTLEDTRGSRPTITVPFANLEHLE